MLAQHDEIGSTFPTARAVAIAEVVAGLGDPERVQILLALEEFGDLSLNLLSDVVDRAPTTTLDHLTWFRLHRLVTIEQEGTRVFYRLLHADLVRSLLHVTAPAADAEHIA